MWTASWVEESVQSQAGFETFSVILDQKKRTQNLTLEEMLVAQLHYVAAPKAERTFRIELLIYKKCCTIN